MKRVKNIILLLVLLLIPNFVNAISINPSESEEYQNYDYVIDSYDVKIKVNENNSFDIKESITAYFNTSKHGIIRNIPTKNKITRLDGTTSTNRARIKNIKVSDPYSKSFANGNVSLKIGSESVTIEGEKPYQIQYTYSIGKDPIDGYDELYFNIIGNEWDTVIGNVTFEIEMPKSFDANKVGFSSGKPGETTNENIYYEISGNKIKGEYNGILKENEGITIRAELDEGYFIYKENPLNKYAIFIITLPILFLIISIALCYKYGKDDECIETVEFYPPNNVGSLELALLYKGKASNKDVVSLLIELANEGYIKISQCTEKILFSKTKTFKIIKIKDYTGNDYSKETFMDGLFKKSKTDEQGYTYVTENDLKDSFYVYINMILKNVNTRKNKNKIFISGNIKYYLLCILMIIISYLLVTLIPLLQYGYIEETITSIVFVTIGFIIIGVSIAIPSTLDNVISTKSGRLISFNWFKYLFTILFGLIFGIIPWFALILPTLLINPVYLIVYIVGIVCCLGMFACLRYMPKRTPYGNEMLGKIKGFRNFLIAAEKDKLEALVEQDPMYFYNILPYTYVLGVSNKWIKNFESIAIRQPEWYVSTDPFNMSDFGVFISSTMTSAQNSMTSLPSSSSGGGFSGGGSGGGGGSSW